MAGILTLLAFATVAQVTLTFASYGQARTPPGSIPVNNTPENASAPIPEAFVSYSIEFAFFPDFAGCFSPGDNRFV
jgi:hypothetical protein